MLSLIHNMSCVFASFTGVIRQMLSGNNLISVRESLLNMKKCLETVCIDPITLEMCTVPMIMCSDGHTYSLQTIMGIMRTSGSIRSPITKELLRGTVAINKRLHMLCTQFGVALKKSPYMSTSNISRLMGATSELTILDVMRMTTVSMPTAPLRMVTQSFHINVNTCSSVHKEMCDMIFMLAGLGSFDTVVITAIVDIDEKKKDMTLVTPTPCTSLMPMYKIISLSFPTLSIIKNKASIGTALITHPKPTTIHDMSLERRLIKHVDDTTLNQLLHEIEK